MAEYSPELQRETLLRLPGGEEVVEWLDPFIAFHDDTILRLDFQTKGTSSIVLEAWRIRPASPDQRRTLTISIAEVVDLELSHFCVQNILFELLFRPAPDPAGLPVYGNQLSKDDIEIDIFPSVGLGGTIRCRGISLSLGPIEVV